MIRIVVFILNIFFIHSTYAQVDSIPPINEIILVSHKGIQYKFPSAFENELNKFLAKSDKYEHFIKLTPLNDSVFVLRVYCMNKSKKRANNSIPILKQTRRYYSYKNESIPIIFETDYLFSTPNFVISHSCYQATFKN